MPDCTICFNEIPESEKVDILLARSGWRYIIGKYTWQQSPYCFSCLQAARKMLWRHFISLLFEGNAACRAGILAELKYWDVPIRLTNNMRINGMPIYSLYYQGEMHSTRLETGMSEYGLERFKEMIKKAKNIISSISSANEDLKLQALFQSLQVTS